jgi:hypothetical protein
MIFKVISHVANHVVFKVNHKVQGHPRTQVGLLYYNTLNKRPHEEGQWYENICLSTTLKLNKQEKPSTSF